MSGANGNDDLTNTATATATATRHQINSTNPYATKKKAPALYRKPLEEFDNFGEEPMSTDAVDDGEKAEGEPSIQEQTATTLDREKGNDEENSDNTTTMQTLTPNTAMSVQLPMWKRLPTHTVSISPAEILTISEVCRHGCLYDNQSVRLTGVLTHRWASKESMGDGKAVEVSLVLEDPLAKLSSDSHYSASRAVAATASRSSRNQVSTAHKHHRASSTLKSRRISFGPTQTTTAATPMSSSRGGEVAAAPAGSSRAPGTGVPTPKQPPASNTAALLPTTPARARTGLLSTTGNSAMSAVKFRTPSLSSRSRKRGLSSISKTPTRKKTIQETMASVLGNPPKAVVWIVVDARHVSVAALAIGDIVTVVGTVQRYTQHTDFIHSSPDGKDDNNTQSESNKTTGDGRLLDTDNARGCRHSVTEDEEPARRKIRRSAATREIGDLILREQHQRQNTHRGIHSSTSSLAVKSNNNHGALFLEARIIRKDNGANLRLHEQALKFRRRHILSTYHSHRLMAATEATAGTTNAVDDTLFLGCGPPPYTQSVSTA